MKWIFWGAAAFIFYAYAGYAAWLWIWSRVSPRPVLRGVNEALVSIVIVVRNEEQTLARKLRNLTSLNYPPDRLEFVIASDGSKDGTADILSDAANDKRFHILISPDAKGKACRVNEAVAAAQGEIVVFMDARQVIEPDAVRLLLENFTDPTVGCVSGELMLGDAASGEAEKRMGVYWRVEKKIRALESASDSVVGATGALYAARRSLLLPIPPETLLDDVLLPMQVARQGSRVIFDGRARAWDDPDLGAEKEFRRKVRTLTGNYQLMQIAPWVLTSENPLWFRFVSHKLLRLAVPFALAVLLVASLAIPDRFYRGAFVLQLAFYGLALFALSKRPHGPLTRLANAVLALVVLNMAAVVALANFVTGRKEVWIR
ncbi:MAG TPA: glycosyltransferase family 2 protein [Candidatus Sulfotelmatobacter sp.]|jgi:cellulose synthase/poly-beta-1,6-N-acetylglucosamine synthase-like glycosyltransferase|nr:glycosyltransferase family 2 protein [Candidatus Sulfotelmatobacter sp.]